MQVTWLPSEAGVFAYLRIAQVQFLMYDRDFEGEISVEQTLQILFVRCAAARTALRKAALRAQK